MSKTIKGSKPCGWEYWGKRPLLDSGRHGKQPGIQRERSILKRELTREPREPEYYEQEYVESCCSCASGDSCSDCF